MRTFKTTKAIKRSEEEYTTSSRFLKLKKEYLKNDDKLFKKYNGVGLVPLNPASRKRNKS